MSDDAPGSWPAPTPPGGSSAEPAATPTGFPPPTEPSTRSPSGPTPAPERAPWWRRRTAGLPVGAWVAVGIVAVLAIVVTAIALSGDAAAPRLAVDVPPAGAVTTPRPTGPDPSAPPVTPTASPPDHSPAPTSSPARGSTAAPSSTAPATPPDDPDGAGQAPESPLPAGDPERSRFVYVDASDVTWTGTIDGVVEVPLYWEEDTGERCFVVLGTITPTGVPGLVSEAWSTPYVTVFIDGEEAEFGDLPCATEEIAAGGHGSLFDANVTAGTEYAFYVDFSLPEDAGQPQAVAVGDGIDAWTFFDATVLDEVPAYRRGPVGPLPVEPLPITDDQPGAFAHTDELIGDAWSGTIAGLVEIPLDEYAEQDGTCYAVLATVTADAVGAGAVTTAYAAPRTGLIAGGRLIDDFSGCSYGAPEDAGYLWFNDAEVTPGTQVSVYRTLFVPEEFAGDLQAIVVGDPWGAPTVLAPHVLGGFPPVDIVPGPPPAGDLAAAGTAFEQVDDYSGTTWTVTVHGHLTNRGASGDQCVTVLVSATLTGGDVGEHPPLIGLIVGGRVVSEDFVCEDPAVREAGYVESTRPRAIGDTVHLYAPFRVPDQLGDPQAIVVGSGDEPPGQVLVAPSALSAVPPVVPVR